VSFNMRLRREKQLEKVTPVRFELTRVASAGAYAAGGPDVGIGQSKPAYSRIYQVPPCLMAAHDRLPLLPHKPHNGRKFTLVIHGGAGTISRTSSTPERQALYKTALRAALEAGYAVLREGGEAMDAAVAAVTALEGRCFH